MSNRPNNYEEFEANFGMAYSDDELLFEPLERGPYEDLQAEFDRLEDEELGEARYHRNTRSMMLD